MPGLATVPRVAVALIASGSFASPELTVNPVAYNASTAGPPAGSEYVAVSPSALNVTPATSNDLFSATFTPVRLTKFPPSTSMNT